MNYIDPVAYSKKILSLMENEVPTTEESIPVEGEMSMKERVSKLSEEDKTKLKQYIDAIKEIKKEIYELVNKEAVSEDGGNRSSGLTMKIQEEIDLNEYDVLLGAIESLLRQGETSQNILTVVKDTLGIH